MIAGLLDQAIAAHQANNPAEAEQLYRAVLADQPDQPDALALLGVLLDTRGDHGAALPLIEKAIRIDPQAALFHFYYGNALRGMGAWARAGMAYERVLQLTPRYAVARNNLALVHEHEGRLDAAVRELRQAVEDQPGYGEGWRNLCNLAEKTGAYKLALLAGQQATALLPGDASAWLGLGVALNRLERHGEALTAYQAALERKPDWTEAWDNLGQSYQYLNRLEEAEAAFRKVIDLAGQAIPDADVLTLDESKFGDRHWHLALLELLKGDYRLGWARYRSRFGAVGGLQRMNYAQPVWRGEDITGKTLLVMDEQGIGDSLMMARYLPLLRARGVRVKFLVHPALAPYLKNWDGADEVLAHNEAPGAFDCYAKIFDLAYCFGSTLATTPAAVPYLPVLPPDGETALPPSGKTRIGVVWGGSPLHKHDYRRSVPLKLFAELFKLHNVEWFSLNRDKRARDDAVLAQHTVTDLAPRLHHFGQLARFVNQMDLVISCDTATAHLAGGMDKPVWTLLPFAPDWRWLLERDDSPWYPAMRLFRQERSGDWDDVIARIKAALMAL